jgi:hypothetical protein
MCQPLCPALPQTGDNSLEFPAPGPYGRSRFTARLNMTWITAGLGVVILIVSFVMMAYSAPGRASLPARPSSVTQASVHTQSRPGPVPAYEHGRELRPSR